MIWLAKILRGVRPSSAPSQREQVLEELARERSETAPRRTVAETVAEHRDVLEPALRRLADSDRRRA